MDEPPALRRRGVETLSYQLAVMVSANAASAPPKSGALLR
jgi:hypothetical protein